MLLQNVKKKTLKNNYNPEKVILVGYSGGATTTGIIIGKHPELIDSAILILCPCSVHQWNKSWKKSSSPHLWEKIEKKPKLELLLESMIKILIQVFQSNILNYSKKMKSKVNY